MRAVYRSPFSPRPANRPAAAAEFAGAEASACDADATVGAAAPSSANQACQQNDKAQQIKVQCRRIARSERTMKSAQPNSSLTCL
jgi:hypothetical protein